MAITKTARDRELDLAVDMLEHPGRYIEGIGPGQWNATPSVIAAHATVSIARSLREIVTELHAIRSES